LEPRPYFAAAIESIRWPIGNGRERGDHVENLGWRVACGDYEIIRALKDGTVQADGLELTILTGHGPRERHWRMARNLGTTSANSTSELISWRASMAWRSPGSRYFYTGAFAMAFPSLT
jgi:hypothetical protein